MKDKTLGEVAEGEVRSTISVVLWAVLSLTSFFYGGRCPKGRGDLLNSIGIPHISGELPLERRASCLVILVFLMYSRKDSYCGKAADRSAV